METLTEGKQERANSPPPSPVAPPSLADPGLAPETPAFRYISHQHFYQQISFLQRNTQLQIYRIGGHCCRSQPDLTGNHNYVLWGGDFAWCESYKNTIIRKKEAWRPTFNPTSKHTRHWGVSRLNENVRIRL